MVNLQPSGFKYEKQLTYLGLGLTILSTILLIKLTIKQDKHIENQISEYNKRNGISDKANNK